VENIGNGSSICPTNESDIYPDIIVKIEAINARSKFQQPADVRDFFWRIKPRESQKKAAANNAMGKCTNKGCNSSIGGILYN
jgi:hypothetical protein